MVVGVVDAVSKSIIDLHGGTVVVIVVWMVVVAGLTSSQSKLHPLRLLELSEVKVKVTDSV